MKLGSLFDGSGTCPLAARMCGIEPVWASEIEPYPIRVTKKNFPGMRHLGDIKQIDGAKIEPVDVITFGSPCQDLSTAGKQAGLIDGERSSLFFEAIRIIREMREATDGKYPRYAVWENVPGAFGSNGGRDFLAVLRAFAGVAGDGDDVPAPEGKGDRLGWSKSGCIMGDGYSIAWRQLDAQYWGVPQRRRRIYLVADFAGQRAGKILFERESLRGNFAPGAAARQRASAETAGGAGGSDQPAEVIGTFMAGQGAKAGSISYSETIAPTLRAGESGTNRAPTICVAKEKAEAYDITGKTSNSMKSPRADNCFRKCDVSRTLDTWAGQPECNQGGMVICVSTGQANAEIMEDKAPTLMAGHERPYIAAFCGGASPSAGSIAYSETVAPTLRAGAGGLLRGATVCIKNTVYDMTHADKVIREYSGASQTLVAGMGMGGNQIPLKLDEARPPRKYILRRLTPLECCRLQGFPDDWTEGVEGSNTAQYKMWGNGMALPCVLYVMQGIAEAGGASDADAAD